jgi:hypothetical protein
MHRSHEAMICSGNFNKNSYIFYNSVVELKNFVVFAFKYVLRSPVLVFNGNFCMNLYSVDSDEVMKRGDEAFNGSSL